MVRFTGRSRPPVALHAAMLSIVLIRPGLSWVTDAQPGQPGPDDGTQWSGVLSLFLPNVAPRLLLS